MTSDLKSINNIKGELNMSDCVFLHKMAKKVADEFGENSMLCEIGSYCGKSTISIASALIEKKVGILYAVDWHEGSPGLPGYDVGDFKSSFKEYIDNLKKFEVIERVITIKSKSSEAVSKVPDKIQFLWIDSSHGYNDVKADYENYHKKLVEKGYLLFHDACWTTWTEPLAFIRDRVLNSQNYNLYALAGNTMVFKKEKNKTPKVIRNILDYLCNFVSGENRPFYKRLISFILLRITSFHARCIVSSRGRQ